MEKEPGPDVIKATQTSLGKYVKRPPLTDKLLKKPPFRFLHDIVTSVLKSTKFFDGLFEDDELISENVKDRDSKILFLTKVISVLALTTGKNLSVKPSKIVAGQDVEKTNELLQCLAYALDKKLSSDEAVAKYKENSKAPTAEDGKTKEKQTKTTKSINDTKKLTSRSSEKLTTKKDSIVNNKNEKTKANEIKSKRKDEKAKNEPVKKAQNLKTVGKKSSLDSSSQGSIKDFPPAQNNHQKDVMLSENDNSSKQSIEIKSDKEITTPKKPSDDVEPNKVSISKDFEENLNNSNENGLNSSLSSQDLMDVENETIANKVETQNEINETKFEHPPYNDHKEDAVKLSVETEEPRTNVKKPRPSLIPKHESTDSEGSRDAERSIKDNIVSTSKSSETPPRPPSVRPSSSRPGAPRIKEKIDNNIPETDNLLLAKVNIITENAQNDEEEDTSVIILEQNAMSEDGSGDQPALQMSSDGHGHLVQQILNSQKELSHGTGKTEIEWQYGAQKAKEASSQEIEQLRFNIQALSRVANPLGKLLDHVQEDVEVMRQELQQWTKVYDEVSRDMFKEKAATEETLVPLQTRVKQLDVDIVEKREKINDIKILIHKNTTRIEKLLANGNVQ